MNVVTSIYFSTKYFKIWCLGIWVRFGHFGERPFWYRLFMLLESYPLDRFSIMILSVNRITQTRPARNFRNVRTSDWSIVKSIFTSSRPSRSLDLNLISSLVRIKAKNPKNQNSTCEIRHQVCSGFCENLIFAEIINRIENLVLGKSQIQPSKDLWAPAEIQILFFVKLYRSQTDWASYLAI